MASVDDDDEPYDLDTDWAKDWSPDHLLVPAVLAQSRPIATITAKQDRCWLVGGLQAEGLTADDIADRLKCSLRLVRTLLAEDMTTVCRLYLTEADHFAEELRLTRHELTVRQRELADERAEAARVRDQRDRMIDMAITGEPIKVCARAGHLMDKYNTYVHPSTGKRSCRACRLEAVRRCRAGSNPDTTDSAPAASGGAAGGLAGTSTAVTAAHDALATADPGPAERPATVAACAVPGGGPRTG